MYKDEFEETLASDEADMLQATGRRISRAEYEWLRGQRQEYNGGEDGDTARMEAEMAKIQAETARMEAAINRMNAAQSGIMEELQRENAETMRLYKVKETRGHVKARIQSLYHKITELREETRRIQEGV